MFIFVYLAVWLVSSSHLKVTTLTAGGAAWGGGVDARLLIPPFVVVPTFLPPGLRGWYVFTIRIESRNFCNCSWTSSAVVPSTINTSTSSSVNNWQEYPTLMAVSERKIIKTMFQDKILDKKNIQTIFFLHYRSIYTYTNDLSRFVPSS